MRKVTLTVYGNKTWEACWAGRIKDLVESGKLSLSAVKYFILDEADRLLDTGNQELILDLFSRFPKAGTGTARLQVLFPCPGVRCEVNPSAGWDDSMADGPGWLSLPPCISVSGSSMLPKCSQFPCKACCGPDCAADGHTGISRTPGGLRPKRRSWRHQETG